MEQRQAQRLHTEDAPDVSPDILDQSTYQELRDSLEVFYREEASSELWGALHYMVEGVSSQQETIAPKVDGVQAYDLVMSFHNRFPADYEVTESQIAWSRAILFQLQPETPIGIFDGNGVAYGILKDKPVLRVSERTPLLYELSYTDRDGEVHERLVSPGAISVMTD